MSEVHSEASDHDLLEVGVRPLHFRRWFSRRRQVELPSSAPAPLFNYDEVCDDLTELLLRADVA